MSHAGIIPIPGGGGGGGIPEAPRDGKGYLRKDGGWAEAATASIPSYTHTQSNAAATWTIQHNLGRKEVTVLIFDGSGEQVIGAVNWAASTTNLLVVQFSEAISGTGHIKY